VRVVRLEQNYRSTQRILRVAAELIARNVRRKEKHLFTENGTGVPVRLVCYPTHRDEAADVAARIADQIAGGRRRARDFAVFYRVNALSRTFETALRSRGVAYQLVNAVEFYQRREIKDVLGYLQLLSNPSDDIALLRVINVPPRGIGKTTLGRLADHATRQGVSMLDAARQCRQIERIAARAAAPLLAFVELFDRLAAVAHRPVEEILGHVLSLSGYRERLENSTDDQDQQRLANIEELLTVAREFDEQHPGGGNLEAFIEETSLVGDTDQWEDASDRVTLMTLHASKGLEFPVVFLTAVEQGLLPHERSLREAESRGTTDAIEEERRLMFVGITRAQEELQISLARQRDFRGRRGPAVASPFLMDLPRAEMEIEEAAAAVVEPERWAEYEAGDAGDEGDYLHEDWGDEAAVGGAPPTSPPRAPIPLRLTTAAELAQGEAARPAFSPDTFAQGMVVLHPEYGLGRIVAIGGAGPRRTATVRFAGPAGEKRFVLASSPLRPVRQERAATPPSGRGEGALE
jgi:DNA helicase II / ATP-dependent DNA helicase PcrA